MADKIIKYLAKLDDIDRQRIREIIVRILNSDLIGLDIKKLKRTGNLYRARVGDHRIIFEKVGDESQIIDVKKRDENTY